ncbi:hypothetical protein [Arcanobacterium buesumense]|uniref:Uncharacterized protein n=1 Tax=Arcanobacterium buesumense TaxID=2722751 RepID=A0A6H2ELT6_9ACTO|nr:hypothetical protein [Arcanobacterium buesumense]QJC22031.1 hypothetical protein HC352_05620 [Arcanobacterium buesumense]
MKILYTIIAGGLTVAGGNLVALSQFVEGWERITYGAGAMLCVSLAWPLVLRLSHLMMKEEN